MNPTASIVESLRGIVTTQLPWLLKLGVWTYVVERVKDDGTIDLKPRSVIPPRLASVPQWLVGGVEVTPVVGSLVGVVYLDAPVPDAKPIPAIVAFAPLRESPPDAIRIGGTSAPAAARKDDVAMWLLFDAAVGLYYSTTSALGPWTLILTNPSTPTPPAPGTPGTPIPIATGSSKVTIA